MALFATPPPDVTVRQYASPYQIDAPGYNPQQPPIPLPPAYNFRDERYKYDTTPIPAPPPGWSVPPRNLASFSPLQVGAVSGGVPRSYMSPDLAGILDRVFGQG
jgi:hypothetical protein